MNSTPSRWSISCCRQVDEQPVGFEHLFTCRHGRGYSALMLRRAFDVLLDLRHRQAAFLEGRQFLRPPE